MFLEIRRGKARHRQRPVSEPVFVVGSSRDCDMVLGDPQFGPIHFFLLSRNGETTIRTLQRRPDITVNGVEASSHRVQDGDRIRTGPYEFVVRAA